MPDDKNIRLKNAVIAVARACQVAREVQQSVDSISKMTKTDRSPVTVADYACQAIIVNELQKVFGEILMVGEESSKALRENGQSLLRTAVVDAVQTSWTNASESAVLDAIDAGNHDGSADAYWTLDPIDGTKGFLRGGQYAISLALIESGEVKTGVLGCPNLSPDFDRPFSDPDPAGLIYYASENGGTWTIPADNPEATPVRILPAATKADAPVRICESVEAAHSRHDETAAVVNELGASGEPARLDSQCKYAVVARGQADAYLRLPTRADYVENIWDHAAGMLIATEAGAVVTDITGADLDFSQGTGLGRNRGIVCASPRFHPAILAAIRKLDIGKGR